MFKGARSQLENFASNTSVHGVGYVAKSKNVLWRILWICAMTSAFGVLISQLVILWKKFDSSPISTKVEVRNSPLRFPSVTICNQNPYRSSAVSFNNDDPDIAALKKAFDDLKQYESDVKFGKEVAKMNADLKSRIEPRPPRNKRETNNNKSTNEEAKINEFNETDSTENSSTNAVNQTLNVNGTEKPVEVKPVEVKPVEVKPVEVKPVEVKPVEVKPVEVKPVEVKPVEVTLEVANFTIIAEETFEVQHARANTIDYDLIIEDVPMNKTKDRLLREELQLKAYQVPYRAMKEYGHQAEDFIQSCRFLGTDCTYENFTRFVSYYFGNCYTFNSEEMNKTAAVMKRSGTLYGLQLTLNVEKDDYMPVLSSGDGVRVVIHDHGTYPFPSHSGFALPTGFETDIGITVRGLERLGHPYGDCENGTRSYKSGKYNTQACKSKCIHDRITEECGCYIFYRTDEEKFLPTPEKPACSNDMDVRCSIKVMRDYARQVFDCECIQPCDETEYMSTSAMNQWPSDGFLPVLEEQICRREEELELPTKKYPYISPCEKIRGNGMDYVKNNFLALSIYFKHLNYESIIQEPAYPLPNFLSDIGGTMGLYAGMSLLTGIEVITLVFGLIHTCITNLRRTGVKHEPVKEISQIA